MKHLLWSSALLLCSCASPSPTPLNVESPAPMCSAVATTTPPSRAYLNASNLPADGIAIAGHSPVSYFDGKVERGDARYAVEHDGITYHLASASQVSRFRADPARYVPAFGGWCAFGMSIGDKFPVDPHDYRIVRGRLFLFLRNAGIDAGELWDKGTEAELIERAEAHWQKVHG